MINHIFQPRQSLHEDKVERSEGTVGWPFMIYVMYLNMSYLTDSYIVFTLKMESVSKNTIFGLKMMVKSAFSQNGPTKLIVWIFGG